MDLTYESLAECVGDDFDLTTPREPIMLTLVGARPHPEPHTGGALDFTGPIDRPVSQGTYPISHPDIGEGLLFLVPVGATTDVRHYEAIFG